MTLANRIAFVALLTCGLFLVGGTALDRPQLSWVGAFVGWFLAAYSALVYLVQAVRAAFANKLVFWPSLIPVNCALALLGVATFGVARASAIGLLLAAVAAIGLAATSAIRAMPRPALRWFPLAALSPIIIPFIEPLSWTWTYIFVGVAVLLLAISAGTRLNLTRQAVPN
jgi:hypothetical protein